MTTTQAERLVSLQVSWGTQSRNQCPTCQRFLVAKPSVVCERCQVRYTYDPLSGLYLSRPL